VVVSRYIYIVFVSFLCFQRAYSQNLSFEQFTTEEGLVSDEVYNVHQDKKGYLWVFTEYGSMKYNGKQFERVLKNLPIKESVIYSVFENESGRTWIANSNKNIYEVRNDSAFAIEGIEQLTKRLKSEAQEIFQIYVDDSLNIFVKTWIYVFKLQKSYGYKIIELNQAIRNSEYYESVYRIGNTYLPFWNFRYAPATQYRAKARYKFVDHTKKSGNFELTIPGFNVVKYCKRFGDLFYLSKHNKIFKLKGDGIIKEIAVNELILNFTKDQNDHLWVACYRDGLREYDEHDSLINHYFKGITINDVLADRDGGLWASSDGHGLYHCNDISRCQFEETSPLGKRVGLLKKIGKDLFVATTDQHLFKLQNKAFFPLKKASDVYNDHPLDLISYDRGYLVCYNSHLELIDRSGKPFFFDANRFFFPYKMILDNTDTVSLLGRNRIMRIHKNDRCIQYKHFEFYDKKFDVKTYSLEKYEDGLLIASDQGVFMFCHNRMTRPAYLKPTIDILVKQIRKGIGDEYWFCTKGYGLFRLQRHKITHYHLPDQQKNDIVNDVVVLEPRKILICTNTGLYYFAGNLDNLKRSVLRRLYTGDVECAVLYRNAIYAGTKNGLQILNSRVLMSQSKVYFNLKSVNVNSEPVGLSSLRQLSYWQNSLEFKFDVVSYNSAEKRNHAIKYVLKGPVIDSGTVNSDKLNLIGLPPGCYHLEAFVDVVAIGEPLVIEFVITPALWQTTWFIVCAIGLSLALVIIGIWFLIRYYKNRALRRSESEKLIAEYRLIALKAQINPHFMSNCIAAIQHLVIQNKVNEANEYLAKFSYLVRQVLNLSNKSLVPLKEELEIIELYLSLEQLRFDKITVKLEVDKDIDIESTFIPPLLSQPIIENAIWHGLLALKNSRVALLQVLVQRQNGMIRMVIEDNGVGRTLKKNGIGNSRESKGIAITRQRIENLTFVIGENLASLIYEDLLDSRGEPAGTRVVILLPDNLHL